MKAITKKIASLAAVALLLFTAFLTAFQAASLSVYAAASAFDDTYVLDDLDGATINGKAFDLADYPADKKGEPQIISFTEFGYADSKAYYGLYIYVYNPQDLDFADTLRNHVQFTFGNKTTYEKYSLQLCNYSTREGYVRRFYKFKVNLSANDVAEIYAEVNKAARVYKVSGIELSAGGEVTEYKCLQEYTYKGYAKGFGEDGESTLTCEVNGIDKYLELEVHHTYYRPVGSNGKHRYTHDSLSSIYFAIPKDVDEEYGVMTRIRGEYLKALTTDIFVTGSDEYYNQFYAMLGIDIGYLVPNSGDFEYIIAAIERYQHGVAMADWAYNLPVEVAADVMRYVSRLNYVIKAKNNDADSYDVSSEELANYMKWYTTSGPGKRDSLVVDKYAASLFEWVDDEMTCFDISSDDFTQSLRSDIITQDWWQKVTGETSTASTEYAGQEAIHRVTDNDFIYYPGSHSINAALTSANLYVAEADVADFKNFYDRYSDDNVIYLVRFAVDDYNCSEAREGKFDRLTSDFEDFFFGLNGKCVIASQYDTNSYLAQEYVYLAFDIIDITLTKNNVSTVMAVVMSPIDIIPGLSHPSQTNPDPARSPEWWQVAIVVAVFILIVVIIYKIIKYFAKKLGGKK